QPNELGILAADFFLKFLGIKKVTWSGKVVRSIEVKAGRKTKTISEKHTEEIPGYIIMRDFERKGRPIAWVFGGKTSSRDGKTITKNDLKRRIKKSANYNLLKEGLCYPYFYSTLPATLRAEMAEAVTLAQERAQSIRTKRELNAKLKELQTEAEAAGTPVPKKYPNIWSYDKTLKGIRINELKDITEEGEIWPYLFRRIIRYWYEENMGRYYENIRQKRDYDSTIEHKVDLDRFFETSNPYLFVVRDRDFYRLDQIVEIKGGRLKMLYPPQTLVFLSF
ncbi:MAG: hypothetical protein AAGD96_34395, partial [Chloroflexota bacterium]